MCVVQIGELVSQLSDETKAQNKAIPWRIIKDTRNFYDYLATEAIQQQIFALNRFAAHIGENVPCDSDMLEHADSAYTALYGSIISEYERLCKELSYTPPKSL